MDKSIQIDNFNRYTRVSRETITSLKKYESLLLKANKKLNLIGNSTIEQLWIRHFLDSSQVIDYIDKNEKSLIDIGSGAGFPGLVLSIISRDRKIALKTKLIEKSSKKVNFLNDVINKLHLNVDVVHKNIMEEPNYFSGDVIVVRAFKSLKVTLQLIHNKARNWKKIFIFLGKTGKHELLQASKIWDIEYKQRASVTSNDSSVIEINKLKKNKLKNSQIISVINQKGGVGKTTTVINLATAISFLNKKVLVIDLDPQGNATTGFGLTSVGEKTVYDVLNGNCNFADAIKDTKIDNLKIVPSNVDLSGLEVETANENRRAFLLKDKIENFVNSEKNNFSYIFIDCPPSLSLLTVMALVVAKSLIVPLQAEFFALEGLSQLVKTIDRIKIKLNPEIDIRGVLLTMFDKRNKLSSEVDAEARKFFKNKVYQTVIPRNVRLSEAPSHGIPVLIYDKSCSGSRSYLNFADEFLRQENVMESAA